MFSHTGSCEVDNNCVRTPGYPLVEHGHNERCEIEILTDVTMTHGSVFGIEECCDHLTIGGVDVNAIADMPQTLNRGSTIEWTSDFSIAYNGWELCFWEGIGK